MATVNVRYMVDDVEAAVAFYTTHLGFALLSSAAPAFADVTRGDLRLLLSGPTSSAGRRPSGMARPAELVGPLSRSRRSPRVTSAKAGAALDRRAKPRWVV